MSQKDKIFELRKKGYDIISWKDHENPQLHWYQLKSRLVERQGKSPVAKQPGNSVITATPGARQSYLFTEDQHGELTAKNN